MIQRYWIFLPVLFLIGCIPRSINAPEPTSLPSAAAEAQGTLIDFFSLLNARKYADAVALYGGSYEVLQGWNPDLDPSDHAALLAIACEQNGLQCLQSRTATLIGLQGDTYVFQVEFNNPDGSLFVLGPCCGANETEMPPVSQFDYRVTRNAEGKFVVMDLPPYVP